MKVAEVIAMPIVVLYLGAGITDSVETALKREEIELTGASAMRELLVNFRAVDSTEEQFEGTALALSTFGKAAVPSLLVELDRGGTLSRSAAQKGLKVIGMSHSAYTCDMLLKVLQDKSQSYSLEAHVAVIQLTGQLLCHEAQKEIEAYAAKMNQDDSSALSNLRQRINEDSEIGIEELTEIRQELDVALEMLRKTSGESN